MKATYGEITKECQYRCAESDEPEAVVSSDCYEECCQKKVEAREIFKDPVTDDGTKKSKKGLLQVFNSKDSGGLNGIFCKDQCTWEQEQKGLLTTIFKDSKLLKETSLDEIRLRLNKQ